MTILNVSASPARQQLARDKVLLGLPSDLALQQAQSLLVETDDSGDFIYNEVHIGSNETGISLVVSRPERSSYWNEGNLAMHNIRKS